MQTVPGWARGLGDGLPKFVAEEGYGGCVRRSGARHCAALPPAGVPLTRAASPVPVARLYRGLTSLWGRQIPYTMMKFAAFERTVQALYANVVPKPKDECTKPEQLGVSFAAGYIAGVFCAVVSHPADNLVSKLNANKAATVGSVINEMGVTALFTRGLPLRIIMVGTLTGLQWGACVAPGVQALSRSR